MLPHGVLFRGGEEGKNNKLRASDIRRIADTVRYRRNTPRYSRTVSLGEIRQNDYNLNIPRYVDSSEAGEKEDVLSVSGDYGIVNQIEFQGRSFAGASVSNYGVVHTGDIVYTKSPLSSNPYGIIKTNKGKTGIVSTLYAVYHPQENTCADFVQTYFEQHARMNNYMHPLVNKGAKNDMKVSAENALKGFVSFPKLEEQKAISEMFSVVDHLITLHQRKEYGLKTYENRSIHYGTF
ncbi:N-6 DNA methylase [Hornefia butyriciproducens]|uniref:N-6 DNA methylase n=1 Tax=Hornefia butyriciproducens TaxID=2652293 RepID=UPI00389ABEA2